MAITLRTVTGSALSHTQLDTNFSSYFYSASVSASVVSLHYTGSSAIGLLPRSSSITLPNSSKWTDIAGGGIARNSQVQITGSTNISGSTAIVGNFTQGLSGVQAFNFSHAEGYFTIASGAYSHAEGYQAVTSGAYSHAEGRETSTAAVAVGSHAEGYQSIASGSYSHAEGDRTRAIGLYSHAEGTQAISSGEGSHAEGARTLASGDHSHAEGVDTVARGTGAHAEGLGTIASGSYQHVQGQFNISSPAQSAFIIGNGIADGSRSNLVFASGSQVQVSGSLNVSGAINTLGNLTVQGNITAQQYIVSTSVYYVTESFASGSHIFGNSADDTHQFTGSVIISPEAILPGTSSIYFGEKSLLTTSSFGIFKDFRGSLAIGTRISGGAYGADGISINGEAKVQLNRISQAYGLYDTTLNIVGSGSNDGITMTQWPDTTNRYTITVQSGSQYKLNFKNSLAPSSGSFDFSGSVAITNDLYVSGNKQYNYGAFQNNTTLSGSANVSHSFQFDTLDEAVGVSVISGSRVTFANGGTYNLQFSSQLDTPTAATVYIWFKKNGTNIPESGTRIRTANNDSVVPAWNFVKTFSAGDYVELVWESNQANTTFPTISAAGNVPICPSIIFTAAQVR